MYWSLEATHNGVGLSLIHQRSASAIEISTSKDMIGTQQCKVNKVKHKPPGQDLSVKASKRCSGLIVA